MFPINNKRPSRSRTIAAASAGGPKDASSTARLLGGAVSGVLELFAFHPVDVCAKRLMSNTQLQVVNPGNLALSKKNFNLVVFREAHDLGVFAKWRSMFPGLGFAAGYKILQRTYKFGGQPIVREKMDNLVGAQLRGVFGEKSGKSLTSACAGSLLGVGEVALLPLDVLKIKAQTNPEFLKGRGLIGIMKTESLSSLYRGAGATALRNAPGSFALFGGATVTHEFLLKSGGSQNASFAQITVASTVGSVCSILVSAPMDVIKTRMQNSAFADKTSAAKIIGKLIREEGTSALFKGLVPKIAIIGPKLTFSMTVATWTMNALAKIV